ncbi:MAG TPA: SDR family oxidoreductase [Candidatus Hydrogenedentes bacterium]|nr:SDR family oxidoreductase [Candidatus Hydrogenedentota bacterium]
MRILLAGGAGYVGSVLTPLLLKNGHEVTVADECWFGTHLPEGVEVIQADLFSLNRTFLRRFDRVVFIAGLSNDPMAEFDPGLNFVQNAALPAYMAYEAREAGVRRFVYGSSCSVYGFTGDEICTEDHKVNCPYPYGISKWQGEQGVMHLVREDFSAIALRQGTVNGHSPRMRFDLVVNTMFKSAMTTGRIVVHDPAIWRPLLDIRDTSRAFLMAIEAPEQISGVFNVAWGNLRIGELAEMIRDTLVSLGGPRAAIETLNRSDYRNYRVDCARVREVLGFTPEHDMVSTVRSLWEHRQEYGDMEREEYYNIRVFRKIRDRLEVTRLRAPEPDVGTKPG